MAGLLRDYEHEDNGAKMGRVAKTATPCLHLEIMEERQDESEESDDTGNAEMASPQKRKLKKGCWAITGSGILAHTITNKRLAQAGWSSILDRYESLHLCN